MTSISGYARTAFGLGLLLAGGAAAADWPAALYNPQAKPDDLVLPMPCGGRMAFRRVDVPESAVLDDRRVQLGGSDDRFRWSENVRPENIAAGFADAKQAGRRFYYLAKYETTAGQFRAFEEPCAAADEKARLPATGVAWSDAVAFAGRYSEWLARSAREALPREDGALGFLRLPTEAEWEYAARGGSAVAPSEFQEAAFPMPDGVHKYVWFQGSRSANNQLQPVGLLQPNPVGLHDVLGNADELVLEPFRLNKLSRLHGQAGGWVAKGGNYLTSEEDIRASYRQELAPYDESGTRRVRTVGFRLALVPPVVTSAKRLEQIKAEWQSLPETGTRIAGEPLEDPVEELAALTKGTDDADMKRRLDGLQTVLKANIAARNQQRDRAARSTIRLGAFLGVKIGEDQRLVAAKRAILDRQEKAGSAQLAEQTRASIAGDEAALKGNLEYYRDTLAQLNAEYPHPVVEAQLRSLSAEFESRKLTQLSPFAATFVRHAKLHADGKLDPSAIVADYAK